FLGCRLRRHAELFSQWLHIHVTEDASRPREANAVETVLSTRGRDFVKQRSVAGQADDVAGLQNVQERIVLVGYARYAIKLQLLPDVERSSAPHEHQAVSPIPEARPLCVDAPGAASDQFSHGVEQV